MIDAVASMPHYRDHIEPVWRALPPQLRGAFHTTAPRSRPNAVLVASYVDAARSAPAPTVYMEHGIGQTYRPGQPSYAGGRAKGNVALFLSPNERVAELNRQAYPASAGAVIGCPLMDKWIGHRPDNPEPVVAFAFHWGGPAQEARPAFPHYQNAIPKLPYKLLGHGHPRAMRWLRPFYDRHAIEYTEDFAEVMERADVLVFDNTSAGYMFAATDRPVVVLDAPWYRRTWGGRFWEWADVGVRIQEPDQLADAIAEALADAPERREERRRMTHEIFGVLDGQATDRAVAAVTEWLA